ncbi:hypothetical protein ACFQU2_19265 [Siccirubricoccus deserti]
MRRHAPCGLPVLALAGLFGLVLAPGTARAQIDQPSLTPRDAGPGLATTPQRQEPLGGIGGGPQQDPNAPVTFTADEVEYDRDRGLVIARGRVEAWQGERLLRADESPMTATPGSPPPAAMSSFWRPTAPCSSPMRRS